MQGVPSNWEVAWRDIGGREVGDYDCMVLMISYIPL